MGAGDWISSLQQQVYLPGRRHKGAPGGRERLAQVWVQVSIHGGSGSNTWEVDMVMVPNAFDHPDDWEVFTPPHGPFGISHPIVIDSADLPQDYRLTVPAGLGPWGLRFTRSGSGTNAVRVTTWSDAG